MKNILKAVCIGIIAIIFVFLLSGFFEKYFIEVMLYLLFGTVISCTYLILKKID